jgi:adenosyl cobinamide kinase/adenosyl cobinamide phosphate guanylyltransferase
MTIPTTIGARPHAERYTSLVTGKTIAVACQCAIGADHEYADWIAMTQDRRRPSSNAA